MHVSVLDILFGALTLFDTLPHTLPLYYNMISQTVSNYDHFYPSILLVWLQSYILPILPSMSWTLDPEEDKDIDLCGKKSTPEDPDFLFNEDAS